MKGPKKILALVLLSCCIYASKPLPAQAASSSTLELEIKAKQCTLDATTTGLQQSLLISPTDCSQRASQLLTSQNATDAMLTGYEEVRFGIQSTTLSDKKPLSLSPVITTPHPPGAADSPPAGNQIPIAVGISLVLALSTDALIFNMYLTQTTLRQFAKVVRFIRSRD